VLAYQSGFEKERKVRRYLERHEFKFTTLLKEDERAESPFGMKVAGSALLIGPDGKVLWRGLRLNPGEIRRALEAAVPAK
jgi:hypothetical protein